MIDPWPIASIMSGMTLGFSLILAIGAQNAFVLRMGSKGQHVFLVTTTCALADTFLISLGVFGIGKFISETTVLRIALGIAGVTFLFVYAFLSLRSAWYGTSSLESDETIKSSLSRRRVIMITLGFSLLNPHAILDTVVLIGGYAAQFPTDVDRAGFAVGTIGASVVFFYTLGYGAKALSPFLKHPRVARSLDLCVGILMLIIAGKLISQFV